MSYALRSTVVAAGTLMAAIMFTAAAKPVRPDAHRLVGATADTSVTGCLQRGPSGNGFGLKDRGGVVRPVMSQSIDLSGHVGHMVTLTGMPATPSNSGMDKSGSMSRAHDSTGLQGTNDSTRMQGMGVKASSLQVTKVAMISASCS